MPPAEDLFYLDLGARNVGIDAVIKRARVNKMSLYRQFGSKDDLLRQYLLCMQTRDFGCILTRVWPNIPGSRALNCGSCSSGSRGEHFVCGRLHRGCPFVNIAVEFPDRSHVARPNGC